MVAAEDIRIIIECDERNEDVDECVVHGQPLIHQRAIERQSDTAHKGEPCLCRPARTRRTAGEVRRISFRLGSANIQTIEVATADPCTDLFDEIKHTLRRAFFTPPQRQPRSAKEHAEAKDRPLVRIDAAGTCKHRALRLQTDAPERRKQRGCIARMLYARADEDGQKRRDRRRRDLKGKEVHICMCTAVRAVDKPGFRRRRRLHEQRLECK